MPESLNSNSAPWPQLPRDPTPPPFPLGSLRSWHQDFVQSIAHARNVIVDAPAVLSLAAIGAAVAKRARLEVQPDDSHPLHVWVMVSMPTGTGKSPVISDVMGRLEAEEQALVNAFKPEFLKLQSTRRILNLRQRHLESRCARTTDENQRLVLAEEAAELARELAELPVPTVPRLLTEDVTPERLVQLLAENHGAIAIASDEGSILFGGLLRRARPGAENLEPLLKAYSGNTIRVDRVGRPDLIVHEPALTIAMAVQPDVLRRLLAAESFAGRGLMERFLYCAPMRNGMRDQSPPPIDDEAIREYRALINWLLRREVFERRTRDVPMMVLSDEAAMHFRKFSAEIDIDPESVSPVLAGWMNKLRTNTARLAGILHAADLGIGEERAAVPVDTVDRAVAIARYFRAQAELALAPQIGIEGETALINWLRRNQLFVFRPHDAHRDMYSRFHRIENVLRAVAALEERGVVRPVLRSDRRGPGRPATEYEVHPDILCLPDEMT